MQFGVIGTSFTITLFLLFVYSRTRGQPWWYSSGAIYLFKQSHSLVPGLGWLAKELPSSACLHLPSAGTTLLTELSISSNHNEWHYLNAEDNVGKTERLSYD